MTKTQAQEIVEQMPADFAAEELVERLLFVAEVEAGLAQADAGETRTQAEAEALAKLWK